MLLLVRNMILWIAGLFGTVVRSYEETGRQWLQRHRLPGQRSWWLAPAAGVCSFTARRVFFLLKKNALPCSLTGTNL